jgi:putative ABC transport system ATP-binding protein
MVSGTLQDNLLFGRVAIDAPDAANRVREVARASLQELGLDREIFRLGLGQEVGPSGKLLQPQQRASLALARAILPGAAVVIIDGAFGAFGAADARRILGGLREELAGRTLLVSMSDAEQAEGFDSLLEFDGPRLVKSRLAAAEIADADDSDNVPPTGRLMRRRELSREGEHAGE